MNGKERHIWETFEKHSDGHKDWLTVSSTVGRGNLKSKKGFLASRLNTGGGQ